MRLLKAYLTAAKIKIQHLLIIAKIKLIELKIKLKTGTL